MKVRPLLNFAVTGIVLLILSGAFVQVLIVDHDLHDATRMGKIKNIRMISVFHVRQCH
jgi:hypothetical protein